MSEKKRFDVLVLSPQDEPVYFVIPSWSKEGDEHTKFLFEERQCPHDFFNAGCELIINEGDTDPHGLFEYVRSFETDLFGTVPGRKGYSPQEEFPKLIPEAFEPDDGLQQALRSDARMVLEAFRDQLPFKLTIEDALDKLGFGTTHPNNPRV